MRRAAAVSPWKHLAAAAGWVCGGLLLGASIHAADVYSVNGVRLCKNGAVWAGGGVDAFDQFGTSDKSGWGIKMVREVVDDLSECPIDANAGVLATSIGYLHPLEEVVNNNRAQGLVTILCPFGWDTSGNTQILGNTPSAMSWYGSFKSRLAAVAGKFAGASDVWIEVWNEPYAWDNAGFSESQWLSDMNDLYRTIRQAGNTNIVLIPGQANDTQETVLLHQGAFLSGKSNVLATLHCYNGWTAYSQASSESRIQAIRHAGWALLFGEVGRDQWSSDCTRLLNASVTQQVPSLGWSWAAADGSSLVNNGAATSWGQQFLPYLAQYGTVSISLAAIANQTVMAGQTLLLTNTATDPYAPPLTYNYRLTLAPAGASINSTNGVFSWRPTVAQSPGSYLVSVSVSDSGTPSLSASRSFSVRVQAPAKPTLQQSKVSGGSFRATVSGDVGPDYTVMASTNLLEWQSLLVTNPASMPFSFADPVSDVGSQCFYRVRMGP